MSLEDIEPQTAKRIAQYRNLFGLTYQDMADKMKHVGCDIHPSAIQKTEKSGRLIRVHELIGYSRVLGVTVGELLGIEESGFDESMKDRLDRIRALSQQIIETTGPALSER